MTPRIRWQVWVLCGIVATLCLTIVLWRRQQTVGDSHGKQQWTMQSQEGDPREQLQAAQGANGKSGRKLFSRPENRPHENAVDKLLAGASSESDRASTLVASLDDRQLAEALRSTNAVFKVAAALEAARRGTPSLISELLSATSSTSDGKTRTAMLAAIASIKSDDCVGQLVSPIGLKKDEDVQQAAKTALLRSGSPVVVDALLARAGANATNEYLCRDVGRTLASMRNEVATSNLLAGINSQSAPIAAGCVIALASIGDAGTVESLFNQVNSAQGFQAALLTDAITRVRSSEALPVLSSQLLSGGANISVNTKRAILTALGNYALEQRAPILNQYLAVESNDQLRAQATQLLNR